MAVTTSDKAVSAYLDNLLNDIGLDFPDESSTIDQSHTHGDFHFHPKDTVDVTRRMVPLLDPFSLMSMTDDQVQQDAHLIWLGIHEMLPMVSQLPPSGLKQYCLRQCQTLMQQAFSRTAGNASRDRY